MIMAYLANDTPDRMWNALQTGTPVREDNFESWKEKACPEVIRFK